MADNKLSELALILKKMAVMVNDKLLGKQDTINDLTDIRKGASSGATAYQVPVGGIPASDLDSNVNASLNNTKMVTVDYEKAFLSFVALESGTFTLTIPSGVTTSYLTSVSYSVDNGVTWVKTNNSSDVVTITTSTVPAGGTVLWKGDGLKYGDSPNNYSVFSSTGNFDVNGNIMSLLYEDDFSGEKTLESSFSFVGLFRNCTHLKDAGSLILPATTLTVSCYSGMFNGCSGLVSAPELPAKTMQASCYIGMFGSCTSLTIAPKLPATVLAESCYDSMFYGCTSLTSTPQLQASTLTEGCYRDMFKNCSGLTRVKCLADNISATSCTSGWVSGVAVSGTFVKDPSMSGWTTGNDGIPTGWAINNGFPDSCNIQADWDISDISSEAYVRNKPSIPKEFVVLKYGISTWEEAYSAYTENRVVYCRASSNSDPSTGNQLRMAFLAYVNDETDPTEFEFQYYRSLATKSASNQMDQVFVYKFNKTSGWSSGSRNTCVKIVTGTNLTSGYTGGTLTISAPNVATLVDGKIPSSQLPSYVDDVIELLNMTDTAPSTCAEGDIYYNTSTKLLYTATGTNTWGSTGETPEGGKIYVNTNNNKEYRWGGTDMREISESLAIGTTQGTAADGKVVNDHVTDNDIHVTASDKSAWSGKQDAINDLSTIRAGAESGATAYQMPSGGIPASDMTAAVQSAITSATTAYQMPVSGIPDADLASPIATNSDVDALFAANGYEYVDLGLSVLWATCNIGANAPEEYGAYFDWGNVTPHYPTGTTFDYGFDDNNYSGTTGAGLTVDIPTNSTYDAARANMGGNWRMPTSADMRELFNDDNCTWMWTTLNGVNGYRVTSNVEGYVGNSIFLPAAGYGLLNSCYDAGNDGRYWTSIIRENDGEALVLKFDVNDVYLPGDEHDSRFNGFSIRGVLDPTTIDPSKIIKLGQLDTYNQKIQEQIGDIQSVLSTI